MGASAAALLCLSLGLAASTGPAEADKVGVAAAVNPDAFSSLSGSPQSQLNIGKSIFFNERIDTTTSGLVQVLWSTARPLPWARARICHRQIRLRPEEGHRPDRRFHVQGVMRFVGGKISKNEDAVKVNTPAACSPFAAACSRCR